MGRRRRARAVVPPGEFRSGRQNPLNPGRFTTDSCRYAGRMNGVLLILIVLVIAAIAFVVYNSSQANGRKSAESLADAQADARRRDRAPRRPGAQPERHRRRLKQAMADASERYTAASSQIDQATTAKQALLAKESAIEGLYYVRAARTAMGMDPGPELESSAGQRTAGTVTEDRRVEFEGRQIEASPTPSERTPQLLPRRTRRGTPRPRGLVLRAVVEAGARRRRLGYRVGAVQHDVQRDGRRRL